MYYAGNGVGLSILVDKALLALVQTETLPITSLLFGPIKLAFLVGWVYLCIYSVRRVEFSPLVSQRHKAMANVFSLFIGPFLLFVLFVADRTRKMQEGEIEFKDVLKEIFGSAFEYGGAGGDGFRQDCPIELQDSSGRSFSEVYGSQDKDKDSSSEVLDLTESIILDSICERASDILIDPKSNAVFTVRFRIDGFLRTVSQIEADKCAAVINSIKAISDMDISEKRRPQDGAFMAKIPEGNVFFRVASAGVLGGEKLSIRVLNQSTGLLKLNEIGLSKKTCNVVANVIKQSSGMIVICGPTGSGKTTSLYAMLSNIDFYARNVVTVEDPIEYVLPNASQIEVNVKADITFVNALRGILRQDPDVICVGEIRDSQTAAMALQASQTGHLVLATLHGSSSMASLVRLMELGAKPLLLASAVSVIVSQRLVRRLCDNCKSPVVLNPKRIAGFERKGINTAAIMQANGCRKCNETGYSGRIGIFDVLYLDKEIKAKLAGDKLTPGDLKRDGDEKSRSTLRGDGLKKVLAGLTTLEEVKRVTSDLG